MALLERPGEDERLPELARHFSEAAALGEAARAVDFCVRAGLYEGALSIARAVGDPVLLGHVLSHRLWATDFTLAGFEAFREENAELLVTAEGIDDQLLCGGLLDQIRIEMIVGHAAESDAALERGSAPSPNVFGFRRSRCKRSG